MRFLKKIKFLIILILFFSASFAQQATTLTTNFEALRNTTEQIVKIYPDSALKLSTNLITLAKSSGSEQLIANALNTLSSVQSANSLINEALASNQASFEINKHLKDNNELVKNYSQFGTIYQNKGDYVNATKYFLLSLDLAKKQKMFDVVNYNYRCLSKINLIQGKNDAALKFANNSLAIENNNARSKAFGLQAIADYYAQINKVDSAEKYYSQSYQILEQSNNFYGMASVLSLWSIIYAEKNIIKTGEMMVKAQIIFDTIAPKSVFSANNIGNIGEVFFTIAKTDSLLIKVKGNGIPLTKEKLLADAEQYLNRCIQYSNESKNVYTALYFTGDLADLQAYIGDYKNAYISMQAKFKYNDSLFSQNNKNAIAKIESEKEVMQLTANNKQKSTLNKILLGSAASLLFIGLLGYRNFKTKQKLQQTQITQLEKDKQLLAIDAMLKGQEEERSRLAKDLHDGLGGMLSGVKISFVNMKENMIMDASSVQSFEASILQLDNTIVELRKVAHNLMPETLVKFGLKNALLDYCNSMQLSSKSKIVYEQMGIDRQLSNTANLYIYRIIQELINNAIKHAQPNQILVQLTKAEKNILITVENDGKYFDITTIKNASGIGIQSVQQRINYFTGKMDMTSDQENGTSIHIELNV